MNRHDRTVLAIIGMSALAGLGGTSVLFLRGGDSTPFESSCFFAEPLEVHQQPAEVQGSRVLRKAPKGIHWVQFADNPVRIIPHSYQATPVEMPFRTRGLVFRPKHSPLLPLGKNLRSYTFRFQPSVVPASQPSGESDPGG